jgi:hypothetical protein
MSLESYIQRPALLDISVDADLTEAVLIRGYEVVAIAMPATLNPDGSSEMTFQVDPGDGVFRSLQDDSTAALTLTNITAGDIAQVQEQKPPIVGVYLKLVLSTVETAADRIFLVMLKKLPD